MLDLARTVRFSVNPRPAPAPSPGPGRDGGSASSERTLPPTNTFAGYPTMQGLGRHYELEVRCRGEADPVSGYFVNIKEIDRAARDAAIPIIGHACLNTPWCEPASILPAVISAMAERMGTGFVSARWWLSPTYSVEMHVDDRSSVLIAQQFDFAASHRLHIDGASDEENRALFGKCNNPSGHGHNYRVEPVVRVPVGPGAPTFTLHDLERITAETVIDRFDHTHLNLDTTEFGPEGLNPSVENIAKVCYDLLRTPIHALPGVSLEAVTVWETDKTRCRYPAPSPAGPSTQPVPADGRAR